MTSISYCCVVAMFLARSTAPGCWPVSDLLLGHLDGSGVVLDHALKEQPLPVARIRLVELLHLVLIQHALQAAVMCASLTLTGGP